MEIPAVANRGDFLRHQSVSKDLAAGRAPTAFKERWLGRYIAYDIESFFVAITEVLLIAMARSRAARRESKIRLSGSVLVPRARARGHKSLLIAMERRPPRMWPSFARNKPRYSQSA